MNTRKWIFKTLYRLRIPHIIHFQNRILKRVPILLFHDVSPKKNSLTGSITPEEFERVIIFVKSKYEIGDLRNIGMATTLKNKCYFAFDDGMLNFYKYAFAIIKKHKIPVTLFIPTNCVTVGSTWNLKYFAYLQHNPKNALKINSQNFKNISEILDQANIDASNKFKLMTWEQLNKINRNDLITIQSHTENHYFLSKLNSTDINRELKKSKTKISKMMGEEVQSIAYPMGDYTNLCVKIAKKHYSFGFKTGDELVKLNDFNPFEIPRIHIDNADIAELYFKINGGHNTIKKITTF